MRNRPVRQILSTILVVVVIVSVAGVGILYATIRTRKEALVDYIATHPDQTALVAYTFDDQGNIIEDGSESFINADQPLVLASTVKLVVLTAYSQAVAEGALDAQQVVSVADWERYYVPRTDGNAHVNGLRLLRIPVDELGFAEDPMSTVTLDDIVEVMIQQSGNAATDYVISQLGEERLQTALADMGMTNHTPVRYLLGDVLAMFDHAYPANDISRMQAVLDQVKSGDTSYLDSLMDLYLHDEDWRQAQIDYIATDDGAGDEDIDSVYDFQVLSGSQFMRGTAREYAQLTAKIAAGTWASPEASEIAQRHLESVPSDDILRLLYHQRLGAKDGIMPGVVTLASYAVPKRGVHAGENRVVVVFVNGMDYELWLSQVMLSVHYVFAADLAYARGVYEELQN